MESSRLPTTAVWNKAEDIAAISTGRRTWSGVHLFRVEDKTFSRIVTPNETDILRRLIPGFTETTLPFISDPKWIKPGTLQVLIGGTAHRGKDDYDQFEFKSVWQVKGNQAMEIKTTAVRSEQN